MAGLTAMAGGIECAGLVVRYGETIAVDRVGFKARPGEILGLLGPNGAGKTSVIRALTTVITPASGSATVAGSPITDSLTVRHRIGVLPESNGYPDHQTAVEYLRFYGRLFGRDTAYATRRALRLLDELALRDRADARIGTFSRGMRQRLGIARALMNDPDVMFLDEPTLGLDPAGKQDILARVATAAHEHGATVLVSSHLLDEVERACDRVVILHRGRVAAAGTVVEVVAAAGVAGRARVRVAPDDTTAAASVLRALAEVNDVRTDGDGGDLLVSLSPEMKPSNLVLAALVEASIAVHRFETASGRLSDAFFALTDADRLTLEAEHAA